MSPRDTKRPTGPTRDPMEVGLARHRKEQVKQLPLWFEEYGSWLIIILIVLLVFVGAAGLSFVGGSPPLPPSAQLVVSYGPVKVWGEGAGTRLSSVSLKVRNIGVIQADGVAVVLTVPGRSFPLAGPATLGAGAECEFSGSINVTLSPTDQVAVGLHCGNCVP
jgi:hypothetical protein